MRHSNNNSLEMRRQGVMYSYLFSRAGMSKLMKGDYACFDNAYQLDKQWRGRVAMETYAKLVCHAYNFLVNHYRDEYVYKNALIGYLLKKHRSGEVVMFNEFASGHSIGDIAAFNSKSVVYEIKTELDTPQRLCRQMTDYGRVFQQRYLVVHDTQAEAYARSADAEVGIIRLGQEKGRAVLDVIREAMDNDDIDSHAVMRCLRSSEYRRMVELYYGELPPMDAFSAFRVCEALIAEIPQEHLTRLFIRLMKERENNTALLRSFSMPLRQICLSMHCGAKEYELITERLNKRIERE